MGSLISQQQLDTVVRHVEDAVAKGARVLTGGKARPDLGPYFFEPTILEGVTPDMTCFGEETFGPVISLYRFHDEADAVARANDGEYGLNASIYSQDGARARAIARYIKCGTVNINEAFGATFASIDSPMGGMRQSGMGRRQGSEGIHRYTESQSVATQRLIRFAPMLGMSDKTYGKVMTANLRLMKKLGGHEHDRLRLRRPGRRLRLRRLGHRAAADREGLPGRRARGGRAVRGRRLLQGHRGRQEVPLGAGARDVRHPADRRGPRHDDRGRRGRRRRVAGLREHALRAAAGVLQRPAVEPHHRLEVRARALLRPGQADARRGREPGPHARGRRDGEGRRRHGRRRHLPPDAGRRLLRRARPGGGRAGRGPVLRRRGPGPPYLPQLRRVHERLPPQRQEHAGQELPLPRRAERRDGPAAHHGHPDHARGPAAGTTSA